MGFDSFFTSVSAGAVSDAVKWAGDAGPLVVLVAGVALFGLLLVILRRMIG